MSGKRYGRENHTFKGKDKSIISNDKEILIIS